jgi:iron complex transport system substrate-binding protein
MRAAALAAVAFLLAGAVHAKVSVTDDEGRTVELPQPARRIVSLAPALTEQLFAIGAGDVIVATTDFADYPAAARSIPRVARAHSIDLERVSAAGCRSSSASRRISRTSPRRSSGSAR